MDEEEKKKEYEEGTGNGKEWNWSENVFEVSHGTGMMVVNICGNLYPPITIPKSVEWLQNNFTPKEYDIFIVSYPKCGTTWMQKICVEIMKLVLIKTTQTIKTTKLNHNSKYLNIDCSNLYFDGKFSNIYYLESMINNDMNYFLSYLYCTDKLYKLNDKFLRFWKSHSFISSFPTKASKNKNKYVVIIRDPKDVIISYYEYLKLVGHPIFKCEFNKFFELFVCGLVPGGNYWDFVLDWYKYFHNNNNNNVLWIYYEDLKRDPLQQILSIIKFFNFNNIINTSEEIKTIIKNSSFNEMKSMVENGKDNYPINFFRKGIVGDHKNYSKLTPQQIDTLDMITNCKFNSMNIKYWMS
eukprot:349833_1